MARKITIPEVEAADNAVQFTLRGIELTSVDSVAVSTLLSLGRVVELATLVEQSSEESDSQASFEMFEVQYKLVLSLIRPVDRPLFEDIVHHANPELSIEELAMITQTLLEGVNGKRQSVIYGLLGVYFRSRRQINGSLIAAGHKSVDDIGSVAFLDYIYYWVIDNIYQQAPLWTVRLSLTLSANFNGELFSSGTLLNSEDDDALLPDEFRNVLSGKKRPDNWYSGESAPEKFG